MKNPSFERSLASYEGKTPNGKLIVDCWHPTKNENEKPRDICKGTHDKHWFICPEENCGHDFDIAIYHVTGNRWCRYCVNKTEGIFHKYTDENKDILKIKSIKIHFKPVWANFKETHFKQTHGTYYEYDFIIELTNGVKIIVEIDGPQHSRQVSNWNSVLYTQIRDKIKERLAVKNGFNIIRLNQEDIYNNKNDWNKKFENYINRKFECKDRIDVTDYADGKRYIKDGQ